MRVQDAFECVFGCVSRCVRMRVQDAFGCVFGCVRMRPMRFKIYPRLDRIDSPVGLVKRSTALSDRNGEFPFEGTSRTTTSQDSKHLSHYSAASGSVAGRDVGGITFLITPSITLVTNFQIRLPRVALFIDHP
ncbi:hypothetical protein JTE90_016655 [Oedothorax gibbosus]|uniref:Uncharacterized protein n=1 Tax=Oedothorax gibbosus TaxID=931172 RepID=A0AAV6V301_9ARAC|nr:hypothetical protein JTE90_016655 [Oedothorax gibbosus]